MVDALRTRPPAAVRSQPATRPPGRTAWKSATSPTISVWTPPTRRPATSPSPPTSRAAPDALPAGLRADEAGLDPGPATGPRPIQELDLDGPAVHLDDPHAVTIRHLDPLGYREGEVNRVLVTLREPALGRVERLPRDRDRQRLHAGQT